jgi:hypothetical protein
MDNSISAVAESSGIGGTIAKTKFISHIFSKDFYHPIGKR